MNKTFTIKKKFGWMEPGDTFELSNDGMYTCTRENTLSDLTKDNNSVFNSKMSVSVSADYINMLKEMGVVDASSEKKTTKQRNVFDEIDDMIDTYNSDLENIESDMKDSPACMKVEKETVLRNLIKTLSYLKSLKY